MTVLAFILRLLYERTSHVVARWYACCDPFLYAVAASLGVGNSVILSATLIIVRVLWRPCDLKMVYILATKLWVLLGCDVLFIR